MASNTVALEAIDQTAKPLCAKIALTEPAISISLARTMLRLRERFKTEYSAPKEFKVSQHTRSLSSVLFQSTSLGLRHLLRERNFQLIRRARGRGGSPSRPSRTELAARNRPARRSGPTYRVNTQCFHQ